ncbi:MAG: hypothetical protein AB1832_01030 [Pseudomonadota bacterium]
MSPGLWQRMRAELAASDQPLTMRELASRLDAIDEITTIRSVLYTMRKRHHVQRVQPAFLDGHYRWRLSPSEKFAINESAR